MCHRLCVVACLLLTMEATSNSKVLWIVVRAVKFCTKYTLCMQIVHNAMRSNGSAQGSTVVTALLSIGHRTSLIHPKGFGVGSRCLWLGFEDIRSTQTALMACFGFARGFDRFLTYRPCYIGNGLQIKGRGGSVSGRGGACKTKPPDAVMNVRKLFQCVGRPRSCALVRARTGNSQRKSGITPHLCAPNLHREIARWEQLIGLTQTPQEARDNYIWWVIVGLCHLVGGLLCVPAVAGVTGDVALPLVRHSILVETGFELVDCLEKGYTRLFHPRGRDIVTNQLAFLVFAHHSTSAALGLPANVYHSDSPLMHEMVLLLQGASAFAILGTQYAMTLNVARVSELRQMQLIASLSCLVIVYTRFVRCLTLSYELLLFFLQKEDTYFVSVGSTCFLLMFVFSAVVLQDTLKRAYKFGTMSAAEAKRRYGAHEK